MCPARGRRISMRRWRRAGGKRRPLPRAARGYLAPEEFFAGRSVSARDQKADVRNCDRRSDGTARPWLSLNRSDIQCQSLVGTYFNTTTRS